MPTRASWWYMHMHFQRHFPPPSPPPPHPQNFRVIPGYSGVPVFPALSPGLTRSLLNRFLSQTCQFPAKSAPNPHAAPCTPAAGHRFQCMPDRLPEGSRPLSQIPVQPPPSGETQICANYTPPRGALNQAKAVSPESQSQSNQNQTWSNQIKLNQTKSNL